MSAEWDQSFRLLRSIRHDIAAQTRHLARDSESTKELANSIRKAMQGVQTFMEETLPEIVAAKTSSACEAFLQRRVEQGSSQNLRRVTSSKDIPATTADCLLPDQVQIADCLMPDPVQIENCQVPENPSNVQAPGGVPKMLPGQIHHPADVDSENGDHVSAWSDKDGSEVPETPRPSSPVEIAHSDRPDRFNPKSHTKTIGQMMKIQTTRSRYLDDQVTDALDPGGKMKLKRILSGIKSLQMDKAKDKSLLNVPRRVARSIVSHTRFEAVVSVIMLLCGLQIGVESDHVMTTGEQDNKVFEAIGLTFNVVFTIELVLRLTSDGCYYFSLHAPNIGWNVLDFVLVFISWLTQLMEIIASFEKGEEKGEGGGMSVELLRMLRLLRIIKVMRIIRVVRFFSELRIMINGILGSSKSLLWALLLLMLIIYLFGVTLMQIITSVKGDRSKLDAQLAFCFGSMGSTMLSLYKAISGGLDWNDCAAPLNDISPVLELIFSAYVFITLFCVLNIITGIFVDNAKALKQMDEDAMFQESLAARKRYVADIAQLFSAFACESGEHFTFNDFMKKMGEIRVQTLFRNLGINLDVTSPEELWELFDIDDNGEIDAAEFSYGVKLFNGTARSIDLFKNRKELKHLTRKVESLMYTVMDGIEETRRIQIQMGITD